MATMTRFEELHPRARRGRFDTKPQSPPDSTLESPRHFTSRTDAIAEIVTTIEASGVVEDAYAEFDIERLADAVLDGRSDGYAFRVSDEEFWEHVQESSVDGYPCPMPDVAPDNVLLAALNATVKPANAAPDLSYWEGGESVAKMTNVLQAAAEAEGADGLQRIDPVPDEYPSDDITLAALNATVKPESAAPDLSYWDDKTSIPQMRAVLRAAANARLTSPTT